jgi:TonB family protein
VSDEHGHERDARQKVREEHGATTIRASKGGGGSKWLLGAAAAVVLVGGAYAALKTLSPDERAEIAYNEPYADEPLRAAPLERDNDARTADITADEPTAAPASSEARSRAPARRSAARADSVTRTDYVAEETIGITPVNATLDASDEVIVRGARRPVWTRTPSERRLSALYPQTALEAGRDGEARLQCMVADDGALDCTRVQETSRNFGNAAMRVARTLRHAPQRADGSDATGTPVNLRVVFKIEEDDRRPRFASR